MRFSTPLTEWGETPRAIRTGRWAIVALLLGLSPTAWPAPRPARLTLLHAAGEHIVNVRGERVALRGYNLGSWLLVEPWMLKLNGQAGIAAEKDIWDQMEARWGAKRMRALVAAHRRNFVAEWDLDRLAQLGANFVRVPIWWRVLGDTHYDPDGWECLDRLLAECERRGLYVLLDLHGAPGGQNTGADILGERPDGAYWDAAGQHRAETVAWWQAVARRYRDRAVVAGYDLLNEAWAAPSVGALVDHLDEVYRAIRAIDPHHLIFVQDALQGYYRLPWPATMGWTNVVYSFHFYPEDGTAFPQRDLAGVRAAQIQYGVPVNIGEFNIYSLERGGVSLLGRCLDVFTALDWSWNLWSYKVLEDNGDYFWGLTGYTDHRLPGLNLQTGAYSEILAYFEHGASVNWREQPAVAACLKRRFRAPGPAAAATRLLPQDALLLAHDAKNGLRVEWQWTPPDLGFWGPADSAAWLVDVPAGRYRLAVCYAAEQRPLAQIYRDGVVAGRATLEPSGDWRAYRWGAIPCGTLSAGRHVLRLAAAGGQSFLNLREARLQPEPDGTGDDPPARIMLTPAEVAGFQRQRAICVEWQQTPPNIGHWIAGEAVVFRFALPAAGKFAPAFQWSSPNQRVRLQAAVNGRQAATYDLIGTGAWHAYEWQRPAAALDLPAGPVELTLTATGFDNAAGAGNLRVVQLERSEHEPSATPAP